MHRSDRTSAPAVGSVERQQVSVRKPQAWCKICCVTMYLEEGRRAVGYDAVTLHLAKAQAAIAGAPLHGLACQDLDRPTAAAVDLIIHHVLKALIVGGVEEDLCLHLAPCVPVVHDFPAARLVAAAVELRGDVVNRDRGEGRCIALQAIARSHLAHERLYQMANGHSRGYGVRIDDEVGHDALRSPGHVLLGVGDANGALLPMPARKFVADLREPYGPHLPQPQDNNSAISNPWKYQDRPTHPDFDKALAVHIGGDQHLVHHARL